MKNRFLIIPILLITCLFSVNATFSWTTKQSRLYLDEAGVETTTSWQTIPYTASPNYPVSQMQYRLQYSGGLKVGNTYQFKISFLPSPDALNSSGIWFSDGTNTLTDVNCSGWFRETNNYYANICNVSPVQDISSSRYLYVRIVFNTGYVNTIRSWVGDVEETKGVASAIQDSSIEIINNQNNNTQQIIDANKVCNQPNLDFSNLSTYGYLDINGNIVSATQNNWKVSDYIKLYNDTTLSFSNSFGSSVVRYCFYDSNQTIITCPQYVNGNVTILSTYKYVRFSVRSTQATTINFKSCDNGNQALTDTLTDDNVSSDVSSASDFLNDLELSNHGGISDIITAPFRLFNALVTDSENDLCVNFMQKNVCLPNGKILWSSSGNHDGAWFSNGGGTLNAFKVLFNLVVSGFLCYKMGLYIFKTIHNALDPANDEVEMVKKL